MALNTGQQEEVLGCLSGCLLWSLASFWLSCLCLKPGSEVGQLSFRGQAWRAGGGTGNFGNPVLLVFAGSSDMQEELEQVRGL